MSDEKTIYLVEITAYDSSIPGTRVLRYASAPGLMTRPTETPANAHYDPRLLQPISFKRTMFSNARVTGGATVGAGEIVLDNVDQVLAGLRDFGIDGRDVVVRLGPVGGAYPGDFTVILTGTAEQAEVGAEVVTIRLRDRLELLDQPLQANLYAGNNALPSGAEGVATDIKGQRKPLLFGARGQVLPVLVNTAKLIYQVHDGALDYIETVYDRGIALSGSGTDHANLAALEAATIAAGEWDTCHALGLFRLGASPAGRVTADAYGDATGGYVNTASRIVERILVGRCGIPSGDLDAASFTGLASAAPYVVGEHFTGETSRQQAIDAILAGVGGWLVPTRTGTWQVGRLVAPSGSPAHIFSDAAIEKLDTRATRDAGAGLPVWQVRLRGLRYSPANAADLAPPASVGIALHAALTSEWRDTAVTDAAVKTKHLLAPEMQLDTPIQGLSDLATEAARLLALHKVRRDYVQARVALTQANAAVDLGAVVRLVTPRLGYTAGRDFVVVGVEHDGKRRHVTLDLWG
jgi:hypothetical protein